MRPYPQYGGLGNSGSYSGISDYNAFELKVQKQMSNGGTLLGSYTFSRLKGNAEGLTSWLDSIVGYNTAGWQDYNDPGSNYSLSSFDARQRLVVSYDYELPIGTGKRFLGGMSAPANAVIGGWGLEGITTFQEGFPLGFSVTPNTIGSLAFQGTLRPDAVSGCGKSFSGSIGSRLGGANAKPYFNTACFAKPTNDFAFGSEPRTDNTLRTPGTDNWDMALFKDFPLHEHLTLDLRAEAFNIFNRVQFGSPNTTVGNTQFGWITAQANNPRLLQFSGRITF